jgi:hypothetical protein
MTSPQTLVEVAQAFHAAQVQWLVVGGYAVVAHGYVRFTQDLDIVVKLDQQNCLLMVQCLKSLGFQSRIPEPMEHFADEAKRSKWREEKDMIVFTVWRQAHGSFDQIDIFLREPFPVVELQPLIWHQTTNTGIDIPCIDLKHLLLMKQEAGRPQDILDIEQLTRVAKALGRLP